MNTIKSLITDILQQFLCLLNEGRGVARGGGGRISKPYSNQGADYAPHTTTSPPGFKKLSTPLEGISKICKKLNIHNRLFEHSHCEMREIKATASNRKSVKKQ